MTFLEWFGSVAATLMLIYVGAGIGSMAALFRGGGLESLAGAASAALLGSSAGFFLALWLVWGVDLLPFIGG